MQGQYVYSFYKIIKPLVPMLDDKYNDNLFHGLDYNHLKLEISLYAADICWLY